MRVTFHGVGVVGFGRVGGFVRTCVCDRTKRYVNKIRKKIKINEQNRYDAHN